MFVIEPLLADFDQKIVRLLLTGDGKSMADCRVEFIEVGDELVHRHRLQLQAWEDNFLLGVGLHVRLVFVVIVDDSLVETIEGGISHTGGEWFHGAWHNLVLIFRLKIEAKDFSSEYVEAAIVIFIAGVHVALHDVSQEIQTLMGVDLVVGAVRIDYVAQVDGRRYSRLNVVDGLNTKNFIYELYIQINDILFNSYKSLWV